MLLRESYGYQTAIPHSKDAAAAIKELSDLSGRQFDPEFVPVFCRVYGVRAGFGSYPTTDTPSEFRAGRSRTWLHAQDFKLGAGSSSYLCLDRHRVGDRWRV
jgi:hypothetical protein